MKYRYFIQLSYRGTAYVGWQIQPNGNSVQGVLEDAFSLMLKERVAITGCGRTDAGVHAYYFIAHFDISSKIDEVDKLLYSLNNYLPVDIALQKIYQVSPDAHARFSATSRTYEYLISRMKNPFNRGLATLNTRDFDIDQLNEASMVLMEYRDFTSFSKLHTDVKTNNCKISKANWTTKDDLLVFEISADRFLRNMVRAIVGTVLDVGLGKKTINEFRNIIEQKDRSKAGTSAPAEGLYLKYVDYPDWITEIKDSQ